MKSIALTKGYEVCVDDDDFAALSQFDWYAHVSGGGRVYAARKDGSWRKGTQTVFYMHRQITGASAGLDVDHADCDTLNNRRSNLRVCTRSQNLANLPPSKAGQFKGICRDGSRWKASISHGGKKLNLGRFERPEEAARAYDAKAREIHGEFARVNFPEAS